MKKRTILLYIDKTRLWEMLNMQERGMVITALLHYQQEEECSIELSAAANMLYEICRQQVDRDNEEYAQKCEKNRKNGAKGGRPEAPKETQNNQTVIEETKRLKEEPKKPDTELELDTDMDMEKKKKDPLAQSVAREKPETLFATFWTAYPRKRNRIDALKAFKALSPNSELLTKMLTSLGRAKTCYDWTKDEGQFIPYPATWLRAHGWENDYSTAAPAKQTEQVHPEQRKNFTERKYDANYLDSFCDTGGTGDV